MWVDREETSKNGEILIDEQHYAAISTLKLEQGFTRSLRAVVIARGCPSEAVAIVAGNRHRQYYSPTMKGERNKQPCPSLCPLFCLCCPLTKPNWKLKLGGAQVKQHCKRGIQGKKKERTENGI